MDRTWTARRVDASRSSVMSKSQRKPGVDVPPIQEQAADQSTQYPQWWPNLGSTRPVTSAPSLASADRYTAFHKLDVQSIHRSSSR